MAKKVTEKSTTKPKAAPVVDDETSDIGNRVYDQWEGRIVLTNKRKDANGKDIYDKKYEPLICQRKNVKITEAEAATLNFSAQESPRMDYVIAYLPAGEGKTGAKVVLAVEEEGEGEE